MNHTLLGNQIFNFMATMLDKIKYLYDGVNHGEPKKWNNKVKLQ